jgi:hypothetical protein
MPFRARILPFAAAASLALLAVPLARAHEQGKPHEHLVVAQAHPAAGEAAAPTLPRTPRPADALLYILSPADGATVESPVTVRFGLKGMGVAPAGVDTPKTGHHHLVVDAPIPALDQPLPADAQHIHFGGGQTETTLELAPGPHELQLVLADKNHVPHDPPLVSERIRITVRPAAAPAP